MRIGIQVNTVTGEIDFRQRVTRDILYCRFMIEKFTIGDYVKYYLGIFPCIIPHKIHQNIFLQQRFTAEKLELEVGVVLAVFDQFTADSIKLLGAIELVRELLKIAFLIAVVAIVVAAIGEYHLKDPTAAQQSGNFIHSGSSLVM
jgi:hypothetical protein